MTNSDHVSDASQFYGIGVPDGTGAPGSTNGDNNALNPSGAPTGDFEVGVSASAVAGSVSVPFGVGTHDAVEATQNEYPVAGTAPDETGAGQGSVSFWPNHPNAGV